MMRPAVENVHALILKLLGIDPKEHEERVAKLVKEHQDRFGDDYDNYESTR